MLTPRGKFPLAGKFSSEEDRTHDAASSRTASPTHNQRAIPAAPCLFLIHEASRQQLSERHLGLLCSSFTADHLVGLVVKASTSRAEDPGFESRLRRDFIPWLPCQAPGVIGSALGLVAPVSVYCDWVSWKV